MTKSVLNFGDHETTRWDRLMQRKAESDDPAERSSLFLGFDIDSGLPVSIPRKTLETNHFHILGRTRSGKTSATLMPLVFQLLQGYVAADGQESPKCTVLVLDLKGDQAFFNATWHASLHAGQRFRYLSTNMQDDYYFFDPFQMFRLGHMLPIQLASAFVRAFSLDYGLVYGGLYFTQKNLDILRMAFEELLSTSPDDLRIENLSRILRRLGKQLNNRDANHIESCLNLLAAYPQVNVSTNQAPPSQNIYMHRAIEESEVLYFFMRMEREAPSLRQIASLALYSLVEAVNYRAAMGLPKHHVFVVIDEFYHIAGTSFGDLLSTVAGAGIHMILANQTREQLANHDRSLPAVIDANTGVKQIFTLVEEDEERLQRASGERTEFRRSYSVNSKMETLSWSEQIGYHLTDEVMKQLSDTLLASLMMISDGRPSAAGKRVLKVQGLFPLSERVHERLDNTPLPMRPIMPPEIEEVRGSETTPQSIKKSEATSPAIATLDERMQKKWLQLDAELGIE